MKLLIPLFLSLTACGSNSPYVEPSLQPTVDMFFALTGAPKHEYNNMISIQIMPLKGKVGVCYSEKDDHAPYRIIIKEGLDELETEATLIHELGHCVLHLKHTSDPYAIMYPYLTNLDYYEANRDELIKALVR